MDVVSGITYNADLLWLSFFGEMAGAGWSGELVTSCDVKVWIEAETPHQLVRGEEDFQKMKSEDFSTALENKK